MSPPLPPPTVEVLIVHPSGSTEVLTLESAPVTVTVATSPEEVYMSFLNGFMNLNFLMFCVALGSLSACLLSILPKVVTVICLLLICTSAFFFFSSYFIFLNLKADLRLRKIQINSGNFRKRMLFGHLSSFCGVCLFFIAFYYLISTVAAAAAAAPSSA